MTNGERMMLLMDVESLDDLDHGIFRPKRLGELSSSALGMLQTVSRNSQDMTPDFNLDYMLTLKSRNQSVLKKSFNTEQSRSFGSSF